MGAVHLGADTVREAHVSVRFAWATPAGGARRAEAEPGSRQCLWQARTSGYYARRTLPQTCSFSHPSLRIVERPAPAAASASPPWALSRRAVIGVSSGLYALSLALPALREVGLGVPDERGYMVLATGWAGVLFLQFAWFANAFWAAGMVYLHRRRWRDAAAFASVAVVVAAESFLLYSTGFISDSGRRIPVRLLVGFWVWWASLWVLAAGAIVLWRRHREGPDSAEVPAADFQRGGGHGA